MCPPLTSVRHGSLGRQYAALGSVCRRFISTSLRLHWHMALLPLRLTCPIRLTTPLTPPDRPPTPLTPPDRPSHAMRHTEYAQVSSDAKSAPKPKPKRQPPTNRQYWSRAVGASQHLTRTQSLLLCMLNQAAKMGTSLQRSQDKVPARHFTTPRPVDQWYAGGQMRYTRTRVESTSC